MLLRLLGSLIRYLRADVVEPTLAGSCIQEDRGGHAHNETGRQDADHDPQPQTPSRLGRRSKTGHLPFAVRLVRCWQDRWILDETGGYRGRERTRCRGRWSNQCFGLKPLSLRFRDNGGFVLQQPRAAIGAEMIPRIILASALRTSSLVFAHSSPIAGYCGHVYGCHTTWSRRCTCRATRSERTT